MNESDRPNFERDLPGGMALARELALTARGKDTTIVLSAALQLAAACMNDTLDNRARFGRIAARMWDHEVERRRTLLPGCKNDPWLRLFPEFAARNTQESK